MKKLKNLLIASLLFVVMLSFVKCNSPRNEAILKELKVQAEKINNRCPIQLVDDVRLDSCVAYSPKTLTTYATMFFVDADTINSEDFEKTNKPDLVAVIAEIDEVQEVRSYGILFVYVYYDDKGQKLGEITIYPGDYNREIDANAISGRGYLISLLKARESALKPNLPIKVYEGAVVIDCKREGDKLEYIFEVSGETAELVKLKSKEALKANMIEELKQESSMKTLLDAGATLRYIYKDDRGVELCQYDVVASDMR